MKKISENLFTIALLTLSFNVLAETAATQRIALITNDQVNVWKTIIYPSQHQQLRAHRHEFNRVLVALDDGELKIINNLGKIHFLKLKKDQAYFLTKDVAGETHTDENMSGHAVKVIVVELKPT